MDKTIVTAHEQVVQILRGLSLTDGLAVMATATATMIAANPDRNKRRQLCKLQDEMTRATVREMVR